jgi:hypothetical protein
MSGTDFNLATSILFVGYLLMQLPSNLLLTRVRPSLFLGIAMGIWGVISACQAAAHSFAGLVVARFFLGFVEAPFFPGAVMLMYVRRSSAEIPLIVAGRVGTRDKNSATASPGSTPAARSPTPLADSSAPVSWVTYTCRTASPDGGGCLSSRASLPLRSPCLSRKHQPFTLPHHPPSNLLTSIGSSSPTTPQQQRGSKTKKKPTPNGA